MKKFSKLLLLPLLSFSLMACGQKPKNIPAAPKKTNLSKYSVATFSAGCFWHEEALFESVKGVQEAISGYAGGSTKNPTYESIETGSTGHAETVNVYYDSTVVSFSTLLKVFFAGQHATQTNGQGNDLGTQYRIIAFYRNANEKKQIDDYMKTIQPKYKTKLAAQVTAFTKFWEAENYHQNFIANNPNQGYVQAVSIPEIREVQKELPQLFKGDHLY